MESIDICFISWGEKKTSGESLNDSFSSMKWKVYLFLKYYTGAYKWLWHIWWDSLTSNVTNPIKYRFFKSFLLPPLFWFTSPSDCFLTLCRQSVEENTKWVLQTWVGIVSLPPHHCRSGHPRPKADHSAS